MAYSLIAPARLPFLLAALACSAALAGALIGEHAFGLQPCVLCLTERVPFALAGGIALALLALPTSPRLRLLGLGLMILAFLANAGIAAYHVGVEQHWWASAVCGGAEEPVALGNLADLRASLSQPGRPACDVVQWRLFGISLAGYNFLYSLMLAAGGLWFLRRAVSAGRA